MTIHVEHQWLERACRRLAKRDRVNPDKWRRYITPEDQARVREEIQRIGFEQFGWTMAVFVLCTVLMMLAIR